MGRLLVRILPAAVLAMITTILGNLLTQAVKQQLGFVGDFLDWQWSGTAIFAAITAGFLFRWGITHLPKIMRYGLGNPTELSSGIACAGIVCTNPVIDWVRVEIENGIVNIKMLIRASFFNEDVTHSRSLKYAAPVIETPEGHIFRLYQIGGTILRDYQFTPGETRTDDMMEFQTRIESRLGQEGFSLLYRHRGQWQTFLEVAPAGKEVYRISLSLDAHLRDLNLLEAEKQ